MISDCTETDSEDGTYFNRCTPVGTGMRRKPPQAALWKSSGDAAIAERFSVFLPEDPSEYAVDSEEGMFYLVICAENAPEGITVTATLMDENWNPVQNKIEYIHTTRDPGKSFRVLFRESVGS